MLDLSANVRKLVNTQKILDFAYKANVTVKVGFPSGETHVSADHRKDKSTPLENMENAELAKVLFFGSEKIPPRPFLEDGIEINKEQIAKACQKCLKQLKQNGKTNFDNVGAQAVGQIQELVSNGFYRETVPNSPQTIKNKKSDNPLIDTANLIRSLTFIVEGKK